MVRARVRLHDDLNPDDVDSLLDILDALSLGRVDIACAIARRLKDYHLAMLIAQVTRCSLCVLHCLDVVDK